MNICVLSDGYPSKNNYRGIFVIKLCEEFADLGHSVNIIAPQSLTRCLINHESLNPKNFVHKTQKGNEIKIFQPYTITFSNWKGFRKMRLFSSKKNCITNNKTLGENSGCFMDTGITDLHCMILFRLQINLYLWLQVNQLSIFITIFL